MAVLWLVLKHPKDSLVKTFNTEKDYAMNVNGAKETQVHHLKSKV